MIPIKEIAPRDAYTMLWELVYRVAKWPTDMKITPINDSFRSLKRAIDQNEILKRDLDEANRALESERKARWQDMVKIDQLQKKLRGKA